MPVPVHRSTASAAAYDDGVDGEIDEILEHDNLVKDTQRYSSLCNYQPFNKKTHAFLNKRTDSYFVPTTIECASTWVLVDTGCNISTISPDLVNFLKKKTPHIQLASLNTLSVSRVTVTNPTNILYSGINI
jgi:hypothetical protein